jgi:hypothetical protein
MRFPVFTGFGALTVLFVAVFLITFASGFSGLAGSRVLIALQLNYLVWLHRKEPGAIVRMTARVPDPNNSQESRQSMPSPSGPAQKASLPAEQMGMHAFGTDPSVLEARFSP